MASLRNLRAVICDELAERQVAGGIGRLDAVVAKRASVGLFKDFETSLSLTPVQDAEQQARGLVRGLTA